MARQLHAQGIAVQIDVVGFDIRDNADVQQLKRIADVTGGGYHDARSRADLDAYFNQLGRALAQAFDGMTCSIREGVTKNWLCDQTMVNRAVARLRDLALRAPAGDPRKAAYEELMDRITTEREKRRARYEQIAARYDVYKAQFDRLTAEINRQLQSR